MYGQYIIIIIIVIVIIIIVIVIIIIDIVLIIYSGKFYKKKVLVPTSKNTRKRKLKAPADQASSSSEGCIPGTPQPKLLTLSASWSSTRTPVQIHLDPRGKL